MIRILAGSLVGQGSMIAVSPVLTRLYSPEDFGALALITSVSAVLGGLVTMSWDRAVVLPADEEQARVLVWLGVLSTVALTAVVALAAFALRGTASDLFGSDVFAVYWWLTPATVLGIALYSIASSWFVRGQQYTRLATRNAVQGLVQAGSSVGLGLLGVSPLGLISSLGVGRFAGLAGLWGKRPAGVSFPSIRDMRAMISTYRKFPLITSWSRVLNGLGLNLPIILMVAFSGSFAVGFLALTMRVLAAPVGILSDAVSQYYEGAFAVRLRAGDPGLKGFLLGISLRLMLAGIVPVLVVAVFGPVLFSWVFGEEWEIAGHYAQVLVFAYFLQLVVSPISRTLNLLQHQGTQLAWDTGRAILTVGVIVAAEVAGAPFVWSVAGYAIVQIVSYIVLLGVCVSLVSRHDARAGNRAGQAPVSAVPLKDSRSSAGTQ